MPARDEDERGLFLAALHIKQTGKSFGDKESEKVASETSMETLRELALKPSLEQRKRMQKRGR